MALKIELRGWNLCIYNTDGYIGDDPAEKVEWSAFRNTTNTTRI